MKFLPEVRHCVYWVLAEIGAPDSSHKNNNKIFYSSLRGSKGSFICVWNCLIFFVAEYSSVWPEICRVFSRIQWWFLCGISGKNYFGGIFHKFSRKPRLCPTFGEISPYFLQFLLCVRIALKKFTQVLSYVVCTQVRRHINKRITKRKYGEEKPGRFVFEKRVLFTLGLRLTTPYSSGALVWNVYQWFVTVCIEFWLRFGTDSSHIIGNKFFINHCQGRKEDSFVCETVWFFSWMNTHSFDLNFVAFFPKFSGDSYVLFQEKTISGEFFRNFRGNQGYPLPNHVKFRPTFCNFYYASVLRWKNSHKYFHMLFAPR